MPRRRTSRARDAIAYGSVALAALGLLAPLAAMSAILLGMASLDLTVGPSAGRASTWVYLPFAVIPIVFGTVAFFVASSVRTRTRKRRHLVAAAQRLGMLSAGTGLVIGILLVLIQGA